MDDLIVWDDTLARTVRHQTCPDVPDPLAVERPPCPRCFTVPAANGECGC